MAVCLSFSVPIKNKIFDFRRENFGCRVTEHHHSMQVSIVFRDEDLIWWVTELISI